MKSVVTPVVRFTGSLALAVALLPAAGIAQFPAPSTARTAPPELGPIEPIERGIGVPVFKPYPETDLTVAAFGLTADGRVTYIVANPGQTAANSPFVVDLYIGSERRDTVKHNPLPGGMQQRVTSNLARPDVCTATPFKVALDTQQLVAERDEANNTLVKTITPPCPDLVVDIDKDSVSNGLKYRAKVQVTNRGNLTTPRDFMLTLMGTSGGASPTNWFALPIMSERRIGPLAPNETASFYEGGDHLGVTRFHYRALADRFNEVRESDEQNNEKRESMGGGSVAVPRLDRVR